MNSHTNSRRLTNGSGNACQPLVDLSPDFDKQLQTMGYKCLRDSDEQPTEERDKLQP